MLTLNHPFDPLLAQQYSDIIDESAVQKIDSRELFYLLNQPVKTQATLFSAYQFICQQQTGSEALASHDSSEAEASLPITALANTLQTTENFSDCINQLAAIHLTQPAWLQNISQISCSQDKTAVQLMSVYLQLKESKNVERYSSLLLVKGYQIPKLYSAHFSQQSNIINEVFDFAVVQLALAQFPRVLLPEILGFTLAYCQMPSLLACCFPKQVLATGFFEGRKQLLDKQQLAIKQCITDYLALFPQQQNIQLRINHGIMLYQSQMQRCRDRLNTFYANQLLPQQAITQIFNAKIKSAIGHHQQVLLEGVSLDKWFLGMPKNNESFLKALKKSHYVDSKNPEKSRLLQLFEFKGPMFGVLNQSELLVLKQWLEGDVQKKMQITSFPCSAWECIPRRSRVPKRRAIQKAFPRRAWEREKYAKLTNRELYYYLINADLYADVLPVAKRKVSYLLRLSALFNPPPFKHYSHQQLDHYIESSYQQEIDAYKPLQGVPKISKAAYLYGLEQIAPMILIDGCWLQNVQILQALYPEISSILYSIYCDEVGNGQLEKNHPYIFQQLLDSQSISLPKVSTKDFVEHKNFISSAFDLPVYMLSLSLFTSEFLPELLGLNMAIELSGLGKSYMKLVDDWKYWQIDPTIAEIHISIDNYASGHTFLAKKAIQLYMDNVMQQAQDRAIVDKQWRRIYSGYASLAFVGSRFKVSLPVCYFMNKLQRQF